MKVVCCNTIALCIVLVAMSFDLAPAQQSAVRRSLQDGQCKTVDAVENFDIAVYASKPWYVHQQAQNTYSPVSRNYCTKAEYTLLDRPTFWGYTVGVDNRASDRLGNQYGGQLCAYQTGESSSKLAVAPCFLPKLAAGPYWVVAYDENEGYALVSGGQPTHSGENGGCRTGRGINDSGLWIFTRNQVRDDALVDKVRSIASNAGFDLSVLNDVDQTNCSH